MDDEACGTNKLEEVAPGQSILELTVPFGECTGAPVCQYVHDGLYRKGKGNDPQDGIPTDCYSSANQLCEMCGPFLVTVRRLVSSIYFWAVIP